MRVLIVLGLVLAACSPAREIVVPDGQGERVVRLGPRNRPGGVFFAVSADRGTWALHVAGSFNRWQPVQYPLTNDPASGVWSGFVPVRQPGRIEYRFIRNGRDWFPDPLTETVADGFGGKNSVFFANPAVTSE